MVSVKYPKNVPHGIMFHHLHGGRHYKGQGSLSQEDFEDILRSVGLDRILDPHEWIRRLNGGQLTEGDLCISFDDGLLCQFDIALPVLEKYNLKAFWFVYSSVFEGDPGSKFEIYRVLRSKFFKNLDDFYQVFFEKVFGSEFGDKTRASLKDADLQEAKRIRPFYTADDIRFRFIRDQVLNPREFEMIADAIIEDCGISFSELSKDLWMTNDNLAYLSSHGHNVGLHSYSHPMVFANLSAEEQYDEYFRNYGHIKRVTAQSPVAMVHPANSYNDDTLRVLSRLGISCGFRSDMFPRRIGEQLNRSRYEMAREDSSNIMKIK